MAFPWDTLGLEGPASEADIRRAYARRLKAIDLEKDAEAFQSLVAARNQALLLVTKRRAEDSPGPVERMPETATGAAHEDPRSAGRIGPRSSAPNDGAGDARSPSPETGGAWDISILTPLRATAPTEQSTHSRPETLAERLEAVSRGGWQADRADEWNAILHELTLLPLGSARGLEPHVINAMVHLILTLEAMSPVPWWKRCRRIDNFRLSNRYTDSRYLKIVLEFSSLYGWLARDGALWEHLDPSTAEQLLIHLRAAQEAQSALEGTRPAVTGKGARPLTRRELRAALDVNMSATVMANYETHLRTGRWPRSWNVLYLIFAPLVMLLGHAKRLLALWLVLVIYLPLKSQSLPYPYNRALLASSLLGAACLHAWMGAYWYRGYIRYTQRLVAQADRFHIFHPNLRWTFLTGLSPDQFGDPKSQWTTKKRIWAGVGLAISFYSVVRLILNLSPIR